MQTDSSGYIPPAPFAKKLPDDMKEAEHFIVSQNQVQDPEGERTKGQSSLKETGKKGKIPYVYVMKGALASLIIPFLARLATGVSGANSIAGLDSEKGKAVSGIVRVRTIYCGGFRLESRR